MPCPRSVRKEVESGLAYAHICVSIEQVVAGRWCECVPNPESTQFEGLECDLEGLVTVEVYADTQTTGPKGLDPGDQRGRGVRHGIGRMRWRNMADSIGRWNVMAPNIQVLCRPLRPATVGLGPRNHR